MMSFSQMPSTHMTHSTDTPEVNNLDIFLGIFIGISIFLLAIIFVFVFLFREQIKLLFRKKFDSTQTTNQNTREIYFEKDQYGLIHPQKENLSESEINIDRSISYSIDEQAYQKEKILDILENNPKGILQSELPDKINLSKATVSRRINELYKDNLISRQPKGRSILILPKI